MRLHCCAKTGNSLRAAELSFIPHLLAYPTSATTGSADPLNSSIDPTYWLNWTPITLAQLTQPATNVSSTEPLPVGTTDPLIS